jgi:pimeloyl-ACP methyl ester carboxylesterase
VVVALVASLAVPTARAAAPADPPGRCNDASWTAGTTEWCRGTFVYRDYVYDDTGADSRPGSPHGTQLSRATGDVDHREHDQALNSADLLALRLSVEHGNLHVRFELNTLFPDDETVAVLALDVDNDDQTGSETVGEFGVRARGIDRVYVFRDGDPDPDDPFLGGVIEGTVPLPPAPGAEWDMYAFTALGDGTVMNVAFRPHETGSWWEAEQSSALAAGDIGEFMGEVTVADLVTGTRDHHRSPGEGLLERVYRSQLAIGDAQEGVDYDNAHRGRSGSGQFAQYFTYLGHHQPYALFVPYIAPAPWGLQLALHGRSAGHASLVSNPGMQQQLGEDLDRIVVVPLGRGAFGYYSDWSERDVLDVMADVEATYAIDRERVFAGGYSMGGYGALRMAALYPDVFAGAISWVGYTGDCLNGTPFGAQGRCPTGAVGNVLRYLDNLRHVPTASLYAAADELVHVSTAMAVRDRFAELGYKHVFWLHAAEHLTLALADQWVKEAAWTRDLRLVHDPAHVTYRTNPALGNVPLGIHHDRAYWIAGIETADTGDGVVDLVSHRCGPGWDRAVTLTNGAGIDPVPWVSQEGVPGDPVAVIAADRITGTLTNVRALTLDTTSPCFSADLTGIDTDTTTVVRFSDGRQPVTLTP